MTTRTPESATPEQREAVRNLLTENIRLGVYPDWPVVSESLAAIFATTDGARAEQSARITALADHYSTLADRHAKLAYGLENAYRLVSGRIRALNEPEPVTGWTCSHCGAHAPFGKPLPHEPGCAHPEDVTDARGLDRVIAWANDRANQTERDIDPQGSGCGRMGLCEPADGTGGKP